MDEKQKQLRQPDSFTMRDTLLVKGVAVLFILAHHLFAYDYRLAAGVGYISLGMYHGSKYETIVGAFCQIGLPMFLVLGGYGTWFSYQHTQDKARKLLQKIGGLYLRFWQVFIIFVPLAVLLHDPMVTVTPWDVCKNFFSLELTYNGEWWFLTPYLLLTALFPLAWLALRGRRPALVDAALVAGFYAAVRYLLPVLAAQPVGTWLENTLLGMRLVGMLDWASPFLMGCVLAKHDGLAACWRWVQNRPVRYALSLVALAMVFVLRVLDICRLDFLLAPVLVVAFATLVRELPFVGRVLLAVGAQSMGIWLVHSFYCYHFCQAFVYSLRWPVLILLLLLAMSYATALLLDHFYGGLSSILHRLKPGRQPQPDANAGTPAPK